MRKWKIISTLWTCHFPHWLVQFSQNLQEQFKKYIGNVPKKVHNAVQTHSLSSKWHRRRNWFHSRNILTHTLDTYGNYFVSFKIGLFCQTCRKYFAPKLYFFRQTYGKYFAHSQLGMKISFLEFSKWRLQEIVQQSSEMVWKRPQHKVDGHERPGP